MSYENKDWKLEIQYMFFSLTTSFNSSSNKFGWFEVCAIRHHHPPSPKAIVICRPLCGFYCFTKSSTAWVTVPFTQPHFNLHKSVPSHTLASQFFYLFNSTDLPPYLSHHILRSYPNLAILNNRTNPKIYFSRTPL